MTTNPRGANIRILHGISTKEELVIEDIGPWDRYQTVTNDAEGVVDALTCMGHLRPGRRLMYYDSGGDLDEILHDGHGRFLGFAPGPNRRKNNG